MKKIDKKTITIVYVVTTLMLLGILGYTFAYFSANVKENNKTETIIKTNELDLIFTGTKEITAENMIPGDSFTKTFTVENPSNVATTFNIYMDNVTNEFNEDLVYMLTDEDGEVITEMPLPVTNTGKSYIVSNVQIESLETKTYTLKIEYKYLDTPQNDYQGKYFKTTLGIDTTPNPSTTIGSAESVSYTNENTECTDVNCALNELYEDIVGE